MAVDAIFAICYNRNKLENTAKFVKLLQRKRALQNKLTSKAQDVILETS